MRADVDGIRKVRPSKEASTTRATLLVMDAVLSTGVGSKKAMEIVSEIENRGILFRERGEG